MSSSTALMQSIPIEDFLVTVLLSHQASHQPFIWYQWLDFNAIHEFTFIISFINPTLVAL